MIRGCRRRHPGRPARRWCGSGSSSPAGTPFLLLGWRGLVPFFLVRVVARTRSCFTAFLCRARRHRTSSFRSPPGTTTTTTTTGSSGSSRSPCPLATRRRLLRRRDPVPGDTRGRPTFPPLSHRRRCPRSRHRSRSRRRPRRTWRR
ncbi:unnamed protein product [Ectocarpus sp. 12 AP-2014]